jgi:hypothetical protein
LDKIRALVKHTSRKGNYETTADHEEPDRGRRSVATHTPTSNILPENDNLIQTITISFQCSALGCEWKNEELMPAMVSDPLKLHHEANHDVSGAPQNRLQKIDHPVIMTGYNQQDFKFFKKEWERYTIASNITEENSLRDMLLQCADLSLQKLLRHTIGSTALANMSVAGLMTEIEKGTSGGVNSKLYEARGRDTTSFCGKMFGEEKRGSGTARIHQIPPRYYTQNLRVTEMPLH